MITWSKGRPSLELEPALPGFTIRMPLVELHLCLVKSEEDPGEYDTALLYPVWGLKPGVDIGINRKSNYRFLGWKSDSSLRGPAPERFLPRDVKFWTTIVLPK